MPEVKSGLEIILEHIDFDTCACEILIVLTYHRILFTWKDQLK